MLIFGVVIFIGWISRSPVKKASNKKDNITITRSDGAAIHNCMTTIVAEITDSKGNLLYYLDDLINNALNDWENIIKKYNIT